MEFAVITARRFEHCPRHGLLVQPVAQATAASLGVGESPIKVRAMHMFVKSCLANVDASDNGSVPKQPAYAARCLPDALNVLDEREPHAIIPGRPEADSRRNGNQRPVQQELRELE